MKVMRWCSIGIIIFGIIGFTNAYALPGHGSIMVGGILAGIIMLCISFGDKEYESTELAEYRESINKIKEGIVRKQEYQKLSDEDKKDFLAYLTAEVEDFINDYNDRKKEYERMRNGTAKYTEGKAIKELSVVMEKLKLKLIAIKEIEKDIDYKNSDVVRIKTSIKKYVESLSNNISEEDF